MFYETARLMDHQMTKALSSSPVRAFTGAHRFLNNSHPVPVYTDGFSYPSAEHAYQASRTNDLKEKQRICDIADPREAQRIGRIIVQRPDWERIRPEMMWQVLVAKFQDYDMHTLLLETANRELRNMNMFHDLTWGVCLCPTHDNTGRNQLGRMLVMLRNELRAGGTGLYAARPWLSKVWV